MKKLVILALAAFALGFSGWSPEAKAEHEHGTEAGMVMVHQCPMDKYTMSTKCPMCGMQMEQKEMTAADAQAAIDKSKDQMRNRTAAS